jgi:hypothetical protein
LRQKLADYSQSEQVYADCRAILGRQCPAKDMPFPPPPHADYYSINVEFEAVKDQKERHELQNLPTSFSLRPQDVDRLRAVGGQLLRESSDFQRLVGSLQ